MTPPTDAATPTEGFSEAEVGSLTDAHGNLPDYEYSGRFRSLDGRLRLYEKMRRSDGQVRGVLNLVKAPITSAQWYIEPASRSDRDIEIAEMVEHARHSMSVSWPKFIREVLVMLDYGFSPFEIVYRMGQWRPKDSERGPARQVVLWRKFAPRPPRTIEEVLTDRNGGLAGIKQFAEYAPGPIPIRKMLWFSYDDEGGDHTGISLLRSAYQHWYYKTNLYKIDAIQKERHALGIPEAVLRNGASNADKKMARELVKNLRANAQAYVVRPETVELGFLSFQGESVDVMKSADHHDLLVARNALAQFVNIGSGQSGARATADEMVKMFLRAERYLADLIAGVLNHFAIPRLVDLNYSGVLDYPRLRVRRIGEEADYRALSVALRNLVESSIVTPDPELEEWTREVMDMPAASSAALERGVGQRVATDDDRPGPPGDDGSSPADPPRRPGAVRPGANGSNRVRKPADG